MGLGGVVGMDGDTDLPHTGAVRSHFTCQVDVVVVALLLMPHIRASAEVAFSTPLRDSQPPPNTHDAHTHARMDARTLAERHAVHVRRLAGGAGGWPAPSIIVACRWWSVAQRRPLPLRFRLVCGCVCLRGRWLWGR